jgi:hypothetical protein
MTARPAATASETGQEPLHPLEFVPAYLSIRSRAIVVLAAATPRLSVT